MPNACKSFVAPWNCGEVSQKSCLMQQWAEQQGWINYMEMRLKNEREHIKKNREDLDAYKIELLARVDAAEKG